MKPIRFSKFLGRSKSLRSFRHVLVAPALVFTLNAAHAGSPAVEPAVTEEAAPASNWIGFTIGGAFVSGNDAGFMRRTRNNGDFYGGIDSMQFSQELNDSTTLTLDGHALPGLEDYEFNIELEKADIGYVKAGFRQYRTWYDGSGGYLTGQPWVEPSTWSEELSLDRGEFSFEAGLRMENLPEVTFSYTHSYREGQKDSLTWADARTVQPAPNNLDAKLLPALWDIDESVHVFELDVAHTFGNTDVDLGLIYENVDYENTRSYMRDNNGVTLVDSYTMDLFGGHVSSVTRFNDRAWLTFGYAYNTIDTDSDGGTRTYDPLVNAGSRDYSYRDMTGGGQMDQMVGNVNLMWNPIDSLTIVPSLRMEHEEVNAMADFQAYNTIPSTASGFQGLQSVASDVDMDSVTGALDLRYTGFADWVLFAKGEWGNEDETVMRRDRILTGEWLRSEIDIDEQEYVLGANWYPMRNLSFSLQGHHSERDQNLDHSAGSQSKSPATANGGANNLRPIIAEHDSDVDAINLRMTWRPLNNVSLVTRYDYRQTEYKNRGVDWNPSTASGSPSSTEILDKVTSGEIDSHVVSQSVTWYPIERLYLQGSAHYTWSQTDTDITYVPDSDSDYASASLTTGYAIDNKTDITASYYYYGASNYAAAAASMGYGFNTAEHSINLTLTRMITPNMIWNLRYGFITSNTDDLPDQTGGNNDFDAHMVSTGLQVRF